MRERWPSAHVLCQEPSIRPPRADWGGDHVAGAETGLIGLVLICVAADGDDLRRACVCVSVRLRKRLAKPVVAGCDRTVLVR